MNADDRSLEERIAELERQVSYLQAAEHLTGPGSGTRWRTKAEIFGWPLVAVATGPSLARGETRGHARGVIAFGDIATGLIAVGGIARGGVAFGGVAIGLIAVGGCAIGLVIAVGGAAVGMFALGGAALGYRAWGGANVSWGE